MSFSQWLEQEDAPGIAGRLGQVNTPNSMDMAQRRMNTYVGSKRYTPYQIAAELARVYQSLIANDPQGELKGKQALRIFWQQRFNFQSQQLYKTNPMNTMNQPNQMPMGQPGPMGSMGGMQGPM